MKSAYFLIKYNKTAQFYSFFKLLGHLKVKDNRGYLKDGRYILEKKITAE